MSASVPPPGQHDDLEAAKPPLSPADKPAPERRSPFRRLLPPKFPDQPTFREFFRRSWLDILTQLLCTLAALLIYLFAEPLLPRHFPLYRGVETSPWGLKHGKPVLKEYISTTVSAVVSFVVPLAVIAILGAWRVRSFWDTNSAYVPSAVCTGDDKKLREAQMSFPSGHSCAAFAGFGFLALYLNAKFGVFAHREGVVNEDRNVEETESGKTEGGEGVVRRTHHWKLIMFVAPLLVTALIAASKVRDGWHHPIDVVAGALIGSAFALMAYKMVYRGVWHQDKNHLATE
ncbi:PAP2-domain-containing protein [Lentithecium fluviatile CBS 122367]|uniref:PAP2-domain-containing protein n=1 Tax=Lentithecium fluviatile CBS 122367 TaxID=1168545 RepID=A0A6G1J0C3_9PLEO|nr:PAP2-domain-containing protein [Lentithecium fluviatile CBS 122367]